MGIRILLTIFKRPHSHRRVAQSSITQSRVTQYLDLVNDVFPQFREGHSVSLIGGYRLAFHFLMLRPRRRHDRRVAHFVPLDQPVLVLHWNITP